MGRPRLHGEQTRERLIAAAGRLVADGGPEALGVRQVALEAGTTTRAVYSLFGSRGGLVQAIYAEGWAALYRRMAAIVDTDDPVTDFIGLCFAYRDHALAGPSRYRVMFERLDGFEASEEGPTVMRCVERLRQVMGRCVASGFFPGRDVEAMILQWWALVHGLASLELQGRLGSEVVGVAGGEPSPARAEQSWREALSAALEGYRVAIGGNSMSSEATPIQTLRRA